MLEPSRELRNEQLHCCSNLIQSNHNSYNPVYTQYRLCWYHHNVGLRGEASHRFLANTKGWAVVTHSPPTDSDCCGPTVTVWTVHHPSIYPLQNKSTPTRRHTVTVTECSDHVAIAQADLPLALSRRCHSSDRCRGDGWRCQLRRLLLVSLGVASRSPCSRRLPEPCERWIWAARISC